MDYHKSKALEHELKGKNFKDYKIIELINNGKSAAVFKAKKDSEFYAVKIFDNELIERFGHEIQTKRIEQEISLKNHDIEGLIKIHEGGNIELLDQKYYFIIMDYVEGKNLKQFIETENYDNNLLYDILEKLFEVTERLLLEKNIVHRDIKPENIMINTMGNVILMDLGVLKLVGAKSFSDEEEKSFVGTLRYAAPEFLLRIEEDSISGWKALNIYQIGATLHDLINKFELFHERVPYSNLVIAIKDDNPKISNDNVPFTIVQLVRDMLSKDWKKRLELVSNDRIKSIRTDIDTADENLELIFKRRIKHYAKFEDIEKLKRTNEEIKQRKIKIASDLHKAFINCLNSLSKKDVFKEIRKSEKFTFKNDFINNKEKIVQNYLFEIRGDLKDGYLRNLYLFSRIVNDEKGYATINLWAIFPSIFTKFDFNNPLTLFNELYKDRTGKRPGIQTGSFRLIQKIEVPFDFKTLEVFNGIAEIDNAFEKQLTNNIIDIINKSLDSVENFVDEKLEYYKKTQETSSFVNESRNNGDTKNIIIDKL